MANTSPPVAGMPVHDRPQFTAPRLQSPVIHNLLRTAVPAIIQQGTVASTGIVTLNQALPQAYPYTWLWLPAGAIVGGAAGWYYTIFSSTTQGQVYQNYVDPTTSQFWPVIPAVELFKAVGSGSAYSVPTSAIRLFNVTIPGNTMGNNGMVDIQAEMAVQNTANTKNLALIHGGLTVSTTSLLQNSLVARLAPRIYNRGVPTVQRCTGFLAASSGLLGIQYSLDTTVDQALVLTVTPSVATEYIIMDSLEINEAPSA